MKRYLLIILLISSVQLFSQEITKKFDLRLGAGLSLLGSGDMSTITFENELNYKINSYFSSSLSLNFGKSYRGIYENTSYLQSNLNIFLSPFKNIRKNNFRIGGGLSLMNVTNSAEPWVDCGVGSPAEVQTLTHTNNSFGFNIILENTYTIANKYLIGLKLFTQPYTNGDINTGILVKFGVVL